MKKKLIKSKKKNLKKNQIKLQKKMPSLKEFKECNKKIVKQKKTFFFYLFNSYL